MFYDNCITITVLLCAFSILGTYSIVPDLKKDFHQIFSDSENVAAYIKENISNDDIILTTPDPCNVAVIAYMPNYNFYNDYTGEPFSYEIWKRDEYTRASIKEAVKTATKLGASKGFYYLLGADVYSDSVLQQYNLLYKTKEDTLRDDRYALIYINLDGR